MKVELLLTGIGSTEPSTFGEVCYALESHIPEKGDKEGWGKFFRAIDKAEKAGYLEVGRERGRIEWMQLTESGAAKAREYQQSKEARI